MKSSDMMPIWIRCGTSSMLPGKSGIPPVVSGVTLSSKGRKRFFGRKEDTTHAQ
jgi:hypothetical protein